MDENYWLHYEGNERLEVGILCIERENDLTELRGILRYRVRVEAAWQTLAH
ncbi:MULTISPECIES: hypothetical protein [unclassified Sinorhizobium]|uniref:hypothetical protein n=1 Tax=unclassified Sinorhizobium TaxID=2613772 RepID=UPI001596A287|nr:MULTISPECIES: hypothetical protein [unclassified Sinorhizobium]